MIALHQLIFNGHVYLGYFITFLVAPIGLTFRKNKKVHRICGYTFLVGMLILYLSVLDILFGDRTPLSYLFTRNLIFNFYGVYIVYPTFIGSLLYYFELIHTSDMLFPQAA